MKITFLGTSSGLPTKERNTQTTILSFAPMKNNFWLFDVGEACQHQILHTTYKLGKLSHIFITHLHGDHIFGLPGILTSRSFQGGEGKPLTVIGPVGIKAFIEMSLNLSASHLNYPIEIIELTNEHETLQIEDIQIKASILNHGITSYGYRMNMPEVQGNLIKEKLQAAGIEPGPIYQLFKSQDSVEYNGEVFETKHYRTPATPGKVITFYGDTMPCENEYGLAQQADLIIHECTYLDGDQDLSHKYYHTHIDDLVQLVQRAEVKKVLINHVSNRYDLALIKSCTEMIQNNYPTLDFDIAFDFFEYEIK